MTDDVLHPARTSPARPLLPALAVAGACGLLGCLTSFAQSVLPAELEPFGNSATAWVLLTALVLRVVGARPPRAALLGAIGLVALVLGYQGTSDLRGFPDSEVLFLLAGILVGPFIGMAVAWLHGRGVRSALGAAILAGIAVGEGTQGVVMWARALPAARGRAARAAVVTDIGSWIPIVLIGVVLLAVLAARLDGQRSRWVAVGGAVAVATAVFAGYSVLGG